MKHPEQQDDEIYLGNTSFEDACKSKWRTKRLGRQAIDRNGKPLALANQLKPWFVKVSEVEAAIEAERKSPFGGSSAVIAALLPLVKARSSIR